MPKSVYGLPGKTPHRLGIIALGCIESYIFLRIGMPPDTIDCYPLASRTLRTSIFLYSKTITLQFCKAILAPTRNNG